VKPEEEESTPEPAEPEIVKKCFRVGSQIYYGDCKEGFGLRKGSFVRHGFGRQVNAAVAPAGRGESGAGGEPACYETLVVSTYEGNWAEDAMSGQGTYRWADGSTYEGHFDDGQLHGPGRFVWPDGSTYEGAWAKGQMNGQGRLDSRFDGSFLQGRFHSNCFQRQDGGWTDVVEEHRHEEQQWILEGDPSSVPVRFCACGELCANNPQQDIRQEQVRELEAAVASTQSEGLVPLFVADESLNWSALQCLGAVHMTDFETQLVSVRMAVTAKRRQQDHHRFFYKAMQSALRTGTLFVIVFEDDDGGCSIVQDEQEKWYRRTPSPGVPCTELPEEWRLGGLFHPSVLPPEVFAPALFNGRGKAKLFLPEALFREASEAGRGPRFPGGGGGALSGTSEVGKEQLPDAATDEAANAPEAEMIESVARAAAAAAAANAPAGAVGLTGHRFQLHSAPTPQAIGLETAYCLRPALAALGRLPAGVSDSETRGHIVERFRRHVPLHRIGVIVLTRAWSPVDL